MSNPYRDGGLRYWAEFFHAPGGGLSIQIWDAEVSKVNPVMAINGNETAWDEIVNLMGGPSGWGRGFLLPIETSADAAASEQTGEKSLAVQIDETLGSKSDRGIKS